MRRKLWGIFEKVDEMINKHLFRKNQKHDVACAFCAKQLTDTNMSKEHVIPNAIGGRKTVSRFICVECNSLTGTEWDKELVNQLRPLCTLLNIKRGRGSNRDFVVETIDGMELLVGPGGSMTIAQPKFNKRDFGDRVEFEMQANKPKRLKKMVSGLQKKYPQINTDEMLRKATTVREYSASPYKIPFKFGGGLADRSVVKSCLALAYEAGLSIDNCEHAKNYLFSDGDECLGFYYENDVVNDRPKTTFFHCVYVCGDPSRKQVLAYVEYFGSLRKVVCLSSDYIGEAFSRGYAIDPVTGKELDLKFDLDIEPEEIPKIFESKKDNDKLIQALEVLFAHWSEMDLERAVLDAIGYALEDTCTEFDFKPGDFLTVKQATEFAEAFTAKLQPFLQHVTIGRKFSSEDLQKILMKSQE